MSKNIFRNKLQIMNINKKTKLLAKLEEKMKSDDTLPLKKGATNLVFGEGGADAEIMFIGEGPGYWEDVKARPFVGNAGALLNQMLAVVGLPREGVFITNVIHYRAPNNRDPMSEELEAFSIYLDKMIEIINPKMIVTLGRFSMAKFLPGVTISAVHGKEKKVAWKKREIVVLPMYHPAAGLRNGEIKRKFIEDFKRIPSVLASVDDLEKKENETKKRQVKQMELV